MEKDSLLQSLIFFKSLISLGRGFDVPEFLNVPSLVHSFMTTHWRW